MLAAGEGGECGRGEMDRGMDWWSGDSCGGLGIEKGKEGEVLKWLPPFYCLLFLLFAFLSEFEGAPLPAVANSRSRGRPSGRTGSGASSA